MDAAKFVPYVMISKFIESLFRRLNKFWKEIEIAERHEHYNHDATFLVFIGKRMHDILTTRSNRF